MMKTSVADANSPRDKVESGASAAGKLSSKPIPYGTDGGARSYRAVHKRQPARQGNSGWAWRGSRKMTNRVVTMSTREPPTNALTGTRAIDGHRYLYRAPQGKSPKPFIWTACALHH